MNYATQESPLLMPEYGRNVQHLIEYCKSLDNRDKRNRCAETIVTTMAKLHPGQANNDELRKKLWDHLAIMANFELDIDYPYGQPKADNIFGQPEKLSTKRNNIQRMHYGRFVQEALTQVATIHDEEERYAFINRIANQMKRDYLLWNKDNVDDNKIIDDLRAMTDNAIDLDIDRIKLMRTEQLRQEVQQMEKLNNNGKKKKKKK